ncbi:zinc finger protein 816-like [Bolinopsis microptera]|uniref:zinc finger protein 816-like n=1 Tax=Bolinopsis microptera TaxID=2820187 RepID=UPI003078FCD4
MRHVECPVKSEDPDPGYSVNPQNGNLVMKTEEKQAGYTVFHPPVVDSLDSSLNPSVAPVAGQSVKVEPDDKNTIELVMATHKHISWIALRTRASLKRKSTSQGGESSRKRKKTHKNIIKCDLNILCTFRTHLKLKLRHHCNTKHAKEKPWKCNKCHFTTTKRSSLDKHNKCHTSHHLYLCEFCDYSTISLIQLDAHIKGHPGDQPTYGCPECDFISCIEKNLYHHLGVAHADSSTADNPWKCDRCPLAFTCKRTLEAHAKFHDQEEGIDKVKEVLPQEGEDNLKFEEVLPEEVCDDLKVPKKSSRKHKKNFYDCELCDFTTRKKLSLRQHINDKHAQEKPWKCSKCHFATGSLKTLIFHEQCHGSEKQNTCHFCDYSTHSAVQLDAHINGHPDARSLKCTECDFRSFVAEHLQDHFNKSHPEEEFNKPTMKWKCKKCDLAFANRKSLNAHVKCHDQEAALYTCSVCQFTASTTKLFDLHMGEHSEKTHKCPKCDYTTYFIDKFNEHLITHLQTQLGKSASSSVARSNEKLWQCGKCDYSSDFEFLLKMHAQIHISEQLCSELGKN